MFPRHQRTKKTTTPWRNNGRYPVNVSLNPIGRDFQASYPECVGLFTVIYPSAPEGSALGVKHSAAPAAFQRDR